MSISERRACAALGQHRSTQRKVPRGREDEEQLTKDLVVLIEAHGRLGYRKMAALLRSTSGWVVNDKRVERIWRQEGLKVPRRQPKRSRIWPSDGACVRLRAERPNHVWSYDFVEDRTHDGRKYRMLNVLDEFTRECLSIRVARKLRSTDVIDVLSDLFILRGVPEHIRSDNGPEFVAKAVQDWITAVGARTAYIAPGSPWENGYIESFNARIRDELLDGEIFYTLAEARVIVEVDLPDFQVESSQGSHFFHNLIARRVGYLKVRHDSATSWMDWGNLARKEVVERTTHCVHARAQTSCIVRMDGRNGRAEIRKCRSGNVQEV